MDCSFSLSLSLSPPKMVIILPVPVGVTVTVYWSLGLLMVGTSSLQVLHLAMASWDSFGLTTSMSLVILLDDIFFCKHTIFCIAKLQNVLNNFYHNSIQAISLFCPQTSDIVKGDPHLILICVALDLITWRILRIINVWVK